jgi:hypothetical protein
LSQTVFAEFGKQQRHLRLRRGDAAPGAKRTLECLVD